mgnify:CR=1 FL=1
MKYHILAFCLSSANSAKTIHSHVGKDSKKLVTHGYNAHKYGIKLGMCKGDCDSGAHCKEGLSCYHSHSSGNIVTGCEGRTKFLHDYCYKASPTNFPTGFPTRYPTYNPTNPSVGEDSKKLVTHGYNAHKYGIKLGMCKGDCDSGAHCKEGLSCYHSHSSGNIVTGCEGRTKLLHDYCYKASPTKFPTTYPTRYPTTQLTNPIVGEDSKKLVTHGYNAHKYGIKLGMCKGDCDSDTHCKKGLKCFHSHRFGNIVTGCEGRTESLHDYCYDPYNTYHSEICNPRNCNDWDNAMWCKCFDVNKEHVYASHGCGNDGEVLMC